MKDRFTGYKLLETGTLVAFDVIDTKIEESPDGEETLVRIDLHLGEVEEDQDDLKEGEQPVRTNDAEWGAFGFIFVLAVLSFHDARPRGISGTWYEDEDQFTVFDLFECLKYERGELQFEADYIRGRCVKTDITIRKDGTCTLATRCRGEAATRWLAMLKGKKMLQAVE